MALFGGHMRAMFALTVCFAGQIVLFSINLWLSMWINRYQNMEVVDTGFYVSVYGGLIFLSSIIFAISTVSMRWGAWTAAHTMHNRLTKSIFAAPLSWFTANPSGQVINRFAKDIMSMDRDLILPLQGTIERALALCLRIGVMGSIMPIFVLPAAMMCVLGSFIGEVYINAQLVVKRLDSAAYSPVFNLFTETLNALPIIRCHRKEHVFSFVLTRRLRLYARTQFTQFNLNRWVAVRTDVASASVGFMAGFLALYKAKDVSASLVGLSLTSAIGLSGTVLQLVRSSNELEASLNSFQRLLEYSTLLLKNRN
jgi:ABC-type multidrug transport system fused ATPase/permease subunit